MLIWALRYFIVAAVLAILMAIPVFVLKGYRFVDDDAPDGAKSRNEIYYVFLWLLTTWLSALAFDVIGLALPYLFRLVAR